MMMMMMMILVMMMMMMMGDMRRNMLRKFAEGGNYSVNSQFLTYLLTNLLTY